MTSFNLEASFHHSKQWTACFYLSSLSSSDHSISSYIQMFFFFSIFYFLVSFAIARVHSSFQLLLLSNWFITDQQKMSFLTIYKARILFSRNIPFSWERSFCFYFGSSCFPGKRFPVPIFFSFAPHLILCFNWSHPVTRFKIITNLLAN